MTYKLTYKLFKDPITKAENITVIKKDNYGEFSIPFDPDNRDYQEYLEWVAAGNTAEAAD
tara:strand:+ start:381 stop:560 length:180 start_codon:yes stop_codon:yes gene_type:complete